MIAKAFIIRPLTATDRDWTVPLLKKHWGSTTIVTRGRIRQADELPGFVAMHDDKYVGLVTYFIEGRECEIISMNSLMEGTGIGSALAEAVRDAASGAGCSRIWLITTNDNTSALRFWQKRRFRLSAVHRNAVEQSRKLKPEIPMVGNDGIPIRDEIELEKLL